VPLASCRIAVVVKRHKLPHGQNAATATLASTFRCSFHARPRSSSTGQTAIGTSHSPRYPSVRPSTLDTQWSMISVSSHASSLDARNRRAGCARRIAVLLRSSRQGARPTLTQIHKTTSVATTVEWRVVSSLISHATSSEAGFRSTHRQATRIAHPVARMDCRRSTTSTNHPTRKRHGSNGATSTARWMSRRCTARHPTTAVRSSPHVATDSRVNQINLALDTATASSPKSFGIRIVGTVAHCLGLTSHLHGSTRPRASPSVISSTVKPAPSPTTATRPANGSTPRTCHATVVVSQVRTPTHWSA